MLGLSRTLTKARFSPCVRPHDINVDGIIVGGDEDTRAQDPADAWVRQADGTVQKLPELVVDGLASAQGINRAGAIVGYSETADGWFKRAPGLGYSLTQKSWNTIVTTLLLPRSTVLGLGGVTAH